MCITEYLVATTRGSLPLWVRCREAETLSFWTTKQYSRWCAMPVPSKRLMLFVIKIYNLQSKEA